MLEEAVGLLLIMQILSLRFIATSPLIDCYTLDCTTFSCLSKEVSVSTTISFSDLSSTMFLELLHLSAASASIDSSVKNPIGFENYCDVVPSEL